MELGGRRRRKCFEASGPRAMAWTSLEASGPGAMAWTSRTSSSGSEGQARPGSSSWAGSPATALTRFVSPAEASEAPKPPPESPDPPSRPLPPQSLEGLQPAGPETGDLERAPIQNSPWKETSLDHPYEKPRKSSEPSSESRFSGRRGGRGAGGACVGT